MVEAAVHCAALYLVPVPHEFPQLSLKGVPHRTVEAAGQLPTIVPAHGVLQTGSVQKLPTHVPEAQLQVGVQVEGTHSNVYLEELQETWAIALAGKKKLTVNPMARIKKKPKIFEQ